MGLLQAAAAHPGRTLGHERADWSELQADIFGEEFLLARPLLAAIRAPDPVVLLIDEVDRLDTETEALLLEVLSDYQVSIPEFGTVTAPRPRWSSSPPTTRASCPRRSSGAACTCTSTIPRPSGNGISCSAGYRASTSAWPARSPGVVRSLRQLELKKRPSVSETIDWARTLSLLGAQEVSTDLVVGTLHVLLKHQSDIEKATTELQRSR